MADFRSWGSADASAFLDIVSLRAEADDSDYNIFQLFLHILSIIFKMKHKVLAAGVQKLLVNLVSNYFASIFCFFSLMPVVFFQVVVKIHWVECERKYV